jgi:2'-5' RNA ligase
MRLFVSVDLDGLESSIAEAQEPLSGLPGVDLTDPGGVHVTLKFLGEVEASRLDELGEALSAAVGDADVGPFEAEIEGYGVFPSPEYVRVVWAGVGEGSEALSRLHEAIESRTVALGFDPEDHEFTPHATLARVRDARSKEEVRDLVRDRYPEVGTLRVSEVRLTESTLTGEGPAYETVATFPLPSPE